MRLVTYETGGGYRGGVLVGETIVDLAVAASGGPPTRPALSVRAALATGLPGPALADAAAALAAAGDGIPIMGTRLGPPIPDPDKILCIGLNYRDHAAEAGLDLPTVPIVFAKFRNSLTGPADDVIVPAVAGAKLDYEVELAVVIGKRARDVAEGDALGHVAGAMPFNDLSARDLQMITTQWTLGKAIDGFAPCGPALVTLDEVGPLDELRLTTDVNGTRYQDGGADQLIFDVPYLVSFLSRTMTLEPGDIIATGTPAGVGFGANPPKYLSDGDLVEIGISGLGTLRNRIVMAG